MIERAKSYIEEQGEDYIIARINTGLWDCVLTKLLFEDGWKKRGILKGDNHITTWLKGDAIVTMLFTKGKNNGRN